MSSSKNVRDKSFRLGHRIYQFDRRFSSSILLSEMKLFRFCWSSVSSPGNEAGFSMKQARMYLEKTLQLLQASQQLLSTTMQKALSSQEVNLEESQIDRATLLDSAVDFTLLNLVFVNISLRDWCRALRVSQRLLLSSSAGEDVMYVPIS